MTRRAIVTGSTGFVGSHLVPALLAEGSEVAVIARPGKQIDTPWANRVTRIDDADVATLSDAVAAYDPDTCFHLATHFVGVHQSEDLAALVEANISFGLRLLEAIHKSGADVSFVNVGTVWQHVDSDAYNPASLYAATKQAFVDLVKFYTEVGTLRAVHLELTDTYGTGDTRRKLLNLLLDAARTGEPLQMSPGEQLFDVLNIDDVIRGLLTSANYASRSFPAYALFNEKPLSVKEFVEVVERVVGEEVPVNWGARPYRSREMLEAWRATELLPNWQPTVELEAGLKKVVGTNR